MFTSLLQLWVAEVRRMLGTGDRRWRGRRPNAGLADGATFASVRFRRFQLVPFGRHGADDSATLAARLGQAAGSCVRPLRPLSCNTSRLMFDPVRLSMVVPARAILLTRLPPRVARRDERSDRRPQMVQPSSKLRSVRWRSLTRRLCRDFHPAVTDGD